MSRQITKELAVKIVKKLKATYDPIASGAHKEYKVHDANGVHVGNIGIRRGSEKDQGHDHIPRDLQIGPNFAKGLGNCPKSRNEYLIHIGAAPDQTPTI